MQLEVAVRELADERRHTTRVQLAEVGGDPDGRGELVGELAGLRDMLEVANSMLYPSSSTIAAVAVLPWPATIVDTTRRPSSSTRIAFVSSARSSSAVASAVT